MFIKEKILNLISKHKKLIVNMESIFFVIELCLLSLFAILFDYTDLNYMWIVPIMRILSIPYLILVILHFVLIINKQFQQGY